MDPGGPAHIYCKDPEQPIRNCLSLIHDQMYVVTTSSHTLSGPGVYRPLQLGSLSIPEGADKFGGT